MIGSSYRQRTKSPLGTVLIINLLGKGLTPRACMGDGGSIWWAPVFGEGKATKENMSIFWFIWPLNWHYLTVRSLKKCCSVDGGRGICPPFFVPTPRIWHLKSPHPREFAIRGKKMLMPGGQPWGGLGAGGIDWCINNGVFLDTYHVSPPNISSLTTVIVIS